MRILFVMAGAGVILFMLIQRFAGAKTLSPDIDSLIKYQADHWSVEYALVKAIVKVESNFDPDAKNPHDPSYGLMQITPILAQEYGLVKDWRSPTYDEIKAIMNPMTNLDIGCRFLNHLSKYPFAQMVQSYNVGETGYRNGARSPEYLEKVRKYYEIYS